MINGWKNGKHTKQWIKTLELYAYPKLGKLKVDQIEGPLIRDVLAEIWLDIPETARRVRQRIGTVLDWSYANGFRTGEAPMRSISKGLPRQSRTAGHFAALPHAEVPAFMKRLHARGISSSRLALEALVLTAARSGEIRGAKWSELDDDLTLWTIPAERTKAGVEHTVPLSSQAADIFRSGARAADQGMRPDLPGCHLRLGTFRHGAAGTGAWDAVARDGAWFPVELQGLGGRGGGRAARDRHGRASTYTRERRRSGIPAH